jgi:hypothetical protein
VFSEHFLEHIPREAAMLILRDSLHALRPGGHVRIALPDLRRFAMGYLYLDQPNSKEQDDGIRQAYGRSRAPPATIQLCRHARHGPHLDLRPHRVDLVARMSASSRFGPAKIRESSVALLHDRESRPPEESALIMEATKPG